MIYCYCLTGDTRRIFVSNINIIYYSRPSRSLTWRASWWVVNLQVIVCHLNLLDGPNVNVALAMCWFNRINYHTFIVFLPYFTFIVLVYFWGWLTFKLYSYTVSNYRCWNYLNLFEIFLFFIYRFTGRRSWIIFETNILRVSPVNSSCIVNTLQYFLKLWTQKLLNPLLNYFPQFAGMLMNIVKWCYYKI